MRVSLPLVVASVIFLSACSPSSPQPSPASLEQQVRDTERAFARTMAARDHAAFVSFLSAETVFFSGDKPLRGRQQVADWWKRYYEKPDAPFSWEPADVQVLDSGTLALSSGPVKDPAGKGVLITE